MMVNLFTGCSLCFVKYEPVSIIASLVICGIVAYNLLRDFELITSGVAARAPKFMEWYCAFGVMVTILWLLSVANRRSDSESS